MQLLLWIDFKLYFYVRIHKLEEQTYTLTQVVNWFQIVFLREDSQVPTISLTPYWRCELISNCIFTWGFTSADTFNISEAVLWIDFKLYFYVRIHKQHTHPTLSHYVVNWFQIVFLREDSQDSTFKWCDCWCCELISNCIFTWGFTSSKTFYKWIDELWIDFKLYFYVRIHK